MAALLLSIPRGTAQNDQRARKDTCHPSGSLLQYGNSGIVSACASRRLAAAVSARNAAAAVKLEAAAAAQEAAR